MFREMRRKKQELSARECTEFLEQSTSGVLALAGDDGYPYSVPITHVYHEGNLYFHSANSGHKIDAIRRCGKASFCVIAQDCVMPQEYTTYYKSVIAFGKIRVLESDEEKRAAIWALSRRYLPEENEASVNEEIRKYWENFCMIVLEVERMTGKQANTLAGQASE